MHLTEKQCALLSEYMYLDQSVKNSETSGKTIDETIKKLKDKTTGQFDMDKLDPTGGITKEEAVEFLKKDRIDVAVANRGFVSVSRRHLGLIPHTRIMRQQTDRTVRRKSHDSGVRIVPIMETGSAGGDR